MSGGCVTQTKAFDIKHFQLDRKRAIWVVETLVIKEALIEAWTIFEHISIDLNAIKISCCYIFRTWSLWDIRWIEFITLNIYKDWEDQTWPW